MLGGPRVELHRTFGGHAPEGVRGLCGCRIFGPPPAISISAAGRGPALAEQLPLAGAIPDDFEEFFWLECGLCLKRRKSKLRTGIAFELTEEGSGEDQA